jgi:hypothetical protein
MYQVVLNMAHSKKVHVIAEYPTQSEALDRFQTLVETNKGSSITSKGKYSVRKKPA